MKIWQQYHGIVKYTNKIGYLKEPFYYYRQRDNSIMSKKVYSPRFLEIITACDTIYKKLQGTIYEKELEYLCIFQLLYYAVYRFLEFGKTEEIKQCAQYVLEKFPNWEQNEYLQKREFLFRFFCKSVVKKRFVFLKILVTIKEKMNQPKKTLKQHKENSDIPKNLKKLSLLILGFI